MKRSDHVVPITKHMAEILQRMFTRRHPGYQHVLTASNGKRPLSDFGAAIDRMRETTGVKDWVLHDMRRVVLVRISDFKDVVSETAEAILAHAKKGMERVYNESTEFVYKKRAALELWHACLFDVLNGKSWKATLRDHSQIKTEKKGRTD